MRVGIAIQTVAQTLAVLTAFAIGLAWHLGQSALAPGNALAALLSYNWSGVDVRSAETMAFAVLSLAELFRAFTVRSERLSIFQIGLFSNPYLVGAVGLSLALLLLVVFVPFLQPIFNTHPLSWAEWQVVLGLSLLPAVRAAGADTLIVADGTSCRHQIADGAQRTAVHVAIVLDAALAAG